LSQVNTAPVGWRKVSAVLDPTCRPPATVALVDDDPAVRHALSFAFETVGIAVDAFSDAEAALRCRDRGEWRCLVLDQKLPGMSGLELLTQLRAEGVTAPTILITTHPSRETKARALAAGVEIVEKPLLDNELSKKVRAFVADPAH